MQTKFDISVLDQVIKKISGVSMPPLSAYIAINMINDLFDEIGIHFGRDYNDNKFFEIEFETDRLNEVMKILFPQAPYEEYIVISRLNLVEAYKFMLLQPGDSMSIFSDRYSNIFIGFKDVEAAVTLKLQIT